MHGPAEEARERIGEHSHEPPEPRPRQRRSDCHRVEVADVVGRDHKRPRRRQRPDAGDAQPEQPAHDQPIERIERHAERGREHAGRREPTCEIRRHGPFTRQRTGFVAALDRHAEQVANRLDAGDVSLRQVDAHALVQGDRNLHPVERVQV